MIRSHSHDAGERGGGAEVRMVCGSSSVREGWDGESGVAQVQIKEVDNRRPAAQRDVPVLTIYCNVD